MSETRAGPENWRPWQLQSLPLAQSRCRSPPLTRKWICAESISVGILGMGLVLAWDRCPQPTIPALPTAGHST